MTHVPTYAFEAEGIRVELDLGIGHVASFAVERDGQTVAPLHRAPWADEADAPAGTAEAPHLARLSGDFFCAPFAASDVEPAPSHGWPANSAWTVFGSRNLDEGGVTTTFRLEKPVMGARLYKQMTLRDHHPFIYQRHIFEGGAGAIPVAHHAMVSLPKGGTLSVSSKRWAETSDGPPEPDPLRGRSVLRYPARVTDLRQFPRSDGGTADLTNYPFEEAQEDVAMLVEAQGAMLGWSAVVRNETCDMALMLKNPARLPVTMLWFSNVGRDYAPWNGRHRGVLGVEDGCTWSSRGHAASIAANALSEVGVPTAVQLDPNGRIEVRQVLGAVPVPEGWRDIETVIATGDTLTITEQSGATLALPYDAQFLTEPA